MLKIKENFQKINFSWMRWLLAFGKTNLFLRNHLLCLKWRVIQIMLDVDIEKIGKIMTYDIDSPLRID